MPIAGSVDDWEKINEKIRILHAEERNRTDTFILLTDRLHVQATTGTEWKFLKRYIKWILYVRDVMCFARGCRRHRRHRHSRRRRRCFRRRFSLFIYVLCVANAQHTNK